MTSRKSTDRKVKKPSKAGAVALSEEDLDQATGGASLATDRDATMQSSLLGHELSHVYQNRKSGD